jgi:hypothetical protein
MHLTLSPMRGLPGQKETALVVAGDTITVDGTLFDLSAVPEGGDAQPAGTHPFTGKITRRDGVIHAFVRIVLGDTAEANQPADPAHWTIANASGVIELPIQRKPEGEPQK